MIVVKEMFKLWAKAYLMQLAAVSSVLNQDGDKDEDGAKDIEKDKVKDGMG